MNSLLQLLFLSFGFTFVFCDLSDEIKCNKDGTQALEGQTDDQLYNLTQNNLVIGKEMVSKRVAVANADGFTCYKQFYDKYIGGLTVILQSGEKERLDKAKTPQERSDAVKTIAGITQAMRCDEDWRAQNLNEIIKSAECTVFESTTSLELLKFKPKLTLLLSGMFGGESVLTFKNSVVSGVVGELLQLFGKIYPEGAQCSKNLPNPEDRCRNMKMFVNEIERLFQLIEVTVLSKL